MLLYQWETVLQGKLIKRYKRFLADVLFDQQPVVVHCPNTGAMTGLLDRAMAPALCSVSQAKGRKYSNTLEAIQPAPGAAWVGVHSALANKMVHAALEAGILKPQLGEYTSIKPEVRFGANNQSRVDFVLTRPPDGPGAAGRQVFVEVKSVTMAEPYESLPGQSIALFPDTVSERAQKHVEELIAVTKAGAEAAAVFVVQRGDCEHFGPSWEKDRRYAQLLQQAAEAGVSLIALRCDIQADADGHASAMFQGFAKVDLNHRQQEFDKEADSKVLKRKRRTKTAAAKAGDGSQADAT